MEPNKPADMPEENGDTYTPGQKAVLQWLCWGAWTAAFIAMLYIMHS